MVVLRSVTLSLLLSVLVAPVAAATSGDFIFHLVVTMNVNELCPNLRVNKAGIRAAAAAAGVGLSKGVPNTDETLREVVKATTFVVMLNDSGGPFACDKVIPVLKEQGWSEFIE